MWELRLCSSGKLCHMGWHTDTNVLKVRVKYKNMWYHIPENHNLNIPAERISNQDVRNLCLIETSVNIFHEYIEFGKNWACNA